jgi:hypothetical protein
MLTFTVPQQIRPFMRSHQRLAYSALFAASSLAMKKLAPDPKFIGADLAGFFGVLHTWGRKLQYHPHIHYVVPGGAISTQDQSWHPSSQSFYLPVHALSRIFRAKFRDRMKKAGLLHKIPPEVWKLGWNVNSQPVSSSEASVKYLAPYVFRVAISNSRIVKVEKGKVYFRYKKQRSRRHRTMALDALEFIRRFLQHVLPSGFMKVRYYGFLSPTSKVPLEEVRTVSRLPTALPSPCRSSTPCRQRPARIVAERCPTASRSRRLVIACRRADLRVSGVLSRRLSCREALMPNRSARQLKRNRTSTPTRGFSRALQPKSLVLRHR